MKYKEDLEYLDFAIANFNMTLTDLDDKGWTALQIAFDDDDLNGFVLMVAHGCDINVRCYPNQWTILHEACLQGRSDWVKALIDNGALPNMKCN